MMLQYGGCIGDGGSCNLTKEHTYHDVCPRTLHHVTGLGIDGIKIFSNRKDREDFLERLPIFVKQIL